jgi:drug/metabolite transporter (DMT)-like permease
MAATAAVFYSETVLSLYPILIKSVTTNLSTQVLARFIVYPIAALIVGGIVPLRHAWSQGHILTDLGLGAVNVAHIAASYLAFQELPAGIAMSLFYTYPLWNLFGASLVFGESFPWHLLPVVLIALLGTYLVATSSTTPDQDIGSASELSTGDATGSASELSTGSASELSTGSTKGLNWIGIGAALVAALTETGLFLAVKGARGESPFFNIHQFYLGGLPVLAALLWWFKDAGLKNIKPIDWNWRKWLPLVAFNGILGFTGYTARFWSIPRLPTIIYSVLSMFGVLASFTWGAVLLGEKISGRAIGGSALLAAAIGYLRYSTR